MIHVVAPRGFGDAICLRAIALHWLWQGEDVTVYAFWPEVFVDLPVRILPHRAAVGVSNLRCAGAYLSDRVSLLSQRPEDLALDSFKITCLAAGIEEDVKLELGWKIRNQGLVDKVTKLTDGRPVMLYQPPKRPKNNLQFLQSPKRHAFVDIVNDRTEFFRVKVGHHKYIADGQDMSCELNLTGPNTIYQILDVSSITNLFFGEWWSFVPVLAQAASKPLLCLFARAALSSGYPIINTPPERVFHKPLLCKAIYDSAGKV